MTARSITIVVCDDGSVQGDYDDRFALWPIGTESTAESTTINGQCRSILDQALKLMIAEDLGGKP